MTLAMATILLAAIPDIYIFGIALIAVLALAFIGLPFLFAKFPQLYTSIVTFFRQKDLIRVAYYMIAQLAFKGMTKETLDAIFKDIIDCVTLAEEMCAASQLAKEERKPYVMNVMQGILLKFNIAWTAEVEAATSSAVELVVTYLGFRGTASST